MFLTPFQVFVDDIVGAEDGLQEFPNGLMRPEQVLSVEGHLLKGCMSKAALTSFHIPLHVFFSRLASHGHASDWT
jgi:hypothetical protein